MSFQLKITTKQRKSDDYCWFCHKYVCSDSTVTCPKCVRCFCGKCSRIKKMSAPEIALTGCTECLIIEKDIIQSQRKNIDVNELVKQVFSLLKKDEYLCNIFMQGGYPSSVINPVDFEEIRRKINANAYKCCEEMRADIDWIVHNSRVHRSDEDNMDESLKWLLQLTKEEFYSIELCHECYLNYNDNSPTKLCVTPHLLVWAKQRSYPHWPAKLIRINQEQKDATVEVRYMGQPHFRAIVHPKNCLMFSKSNPSLGKIRQFETQLKEAETEALEYIENIKRKYGTFNYYPEETELDIKNMERHLYDVIPNAWRALNKTSQPHPLAKPKPRSATAARRQSVPARRTSVAHTGHRITRRMSTFLHMSPEEIFVEEANELKRPASQAFKPLTSTVAPGGPRNSIAVPKKIPHKRHSTAVMESTAAKKKKTRSHDTHRRSDTSAMKPLVQRTATVTSQSDGVFIVPLIPVKKLIVSTKPKTTQSNGVQTPVPSQPKPSSSIEPPKCSRTYVVPPKTGGKPAEPLKSSQNDYEEPECSRKPRKLNESLFELDFEPSTSNLFNAILKNNSIGMTKYIRASLASTVLDSANHTQIGPRSDMKKQLKLQKEHFDKMMYFLQKNQDLKEQIAVLNDNQMNFGKEKMQMTQQIHNLKQSVQFLTTENGLLTNHVQKMAVKYTQYYTHLQKEQMEERFKVNQQEKVGLEERTKHLEATKRQLSLCYRGIEARYQQSEARCTQIEANSTYLRQELLTLQQHNAENANQIIHLQLAQKNMESQHAKKIVEVKKWDWCQACDEPKFRRHFCNPQCEQQYLSRANQIRK